ncbi:MAG: hypothetical protein V1773_05165 [bacterium]
MKTPKLLFFQLLILSLFFVSSIYSQSYAIDKGSMLISGAFSFSSAGGDLYKDSDDNNLVTMQLNTSIGYFISQGFNLGGKLLFNRSSQGDYTSTMIGIGPVVSYYFGDSQSKAYPYIGASVLYVSNSYESESTYLGVTTTHETTINGSTIYFGGGVCYMLSKAIGLFGEVGYQIDNLSDDDDNSSSGNKINLTIGIAAFLF